MEEPDVTISAGIPLQRGMKAPLTMWVLIDLDNGHERSKRYLWWFETRALAREFKRHHKETYPNGATLSAPIQYRASNSAPVFVARAW